MDPQAALDNAEHAIADGDWDAAQEFLDHYTTWRARGGFQPKSGDAIARNLATTIRDQRVSHQISAATNLLDWGDFIRGASRAIWADAWMSAIEDMIDDRDARRAGLIPGGGERWEDYIPDAPRVALRDGVKLARKLKAKTADVAKINAGLANGRLPDSETVGWYAAMQYLGHDVGLGDYGIYIKLSYGEPSTGLRNAAQEQAHAISEKALIVSNLLEWNYFIRGAARIFWYETWRYTITEQLDRQEAISAGLAPGINGRWQDYTPDTPLAAFRDGAKFARKLKDNKAVIAEINAALAEGRISHSEHAGAYAAIRSMGHKVGNFGVIFGDEIEIPYSGTPMDTRNAAYDRVVALAEEHDLKLHQDLDGTSTVTDGQIRALRREAAEAGDFAMVAICDLALNGEINVDNYFTLTPREAHRIRALDWQEAHDLCQDAIIH